MGRGEGTSQWDKMIAEIGEVFRRCDQAADSMERDPIAARLRGYHSVMAAIEKRNEQLHELLVLIRQLSEDYDLALQETERLMRELLEGIKQERGGSDGS
jgi:hypothetical protein